MEQIAGFRVDNISLSVFNETGLFCRKKFYGMSIKMFLLSVGVLNEFHQLQKTDNSAKLPMHWGSKNIGHRIKVANKCDYSAYDFLLFT